MYAEIIGKLHASNMKLFTYPSEIDVFTSLSQLIKPILFSDYVQSSARYKVPIIIKALGD